ncbi:hypothetical protein KJ855_01400 [Patescibacteria group bacterium]|nr:hypothetical protein [Patescibacteria group bacterium]
MTYIKTIITVFILFFLYLLQSSMPFHINIQDVTINILFCVAMGLVLTDNDLKNWSIIAIIVVLLELNTSIVFGYNPLVIIVIGFIALYTKKLFTDQFLINILVPILLSILYEISILFLAYLYFDYDPGQIINYLVQIGLLEMLLHYTMIVISSSTLFHIYNKSAAKIDFAPDIN